jgi:hypothetical protein
MRRFSIISWIDGIAAVESAAMIPSATTTSIKLKPE